LPTYVCSVLPNSLTLGSGSFRVGRALESGMVGINEWIITSEAAPFGGVKDSVIGPRGLDTGDRGINI
jgi:acyl-CoA reductase-like NAD-dependent aldehyde dehydrogenase